MEAPLLDVVDALVSLGCPSKRSVAGKKRLHAEQQKRKTRLVAAKLRILSMCGFSSLDMAKAKYPRSWCVVMSKIESRLNLQPKCHHYILAEFNKNEVKSSHVSVRCPQCNMIATLSSTLSSDTRVCNCNCHNCQRFVARDNENSAHNLVM